MGGLGCDGAGLLLTSAEQEIEERARLSWRGIRRIARRQRFSFSSSQFPFDPPAVSGHQPDEVTLAPQIVDWGWVRERKW